MNRKTQSHLGTLKQNGVHLKEHEYATIKVFLESGCNIELIPPSNIKGLHLPDIYINGVPWEIKAPEGSGRKTIKHNIQQALHQSPNIILDLRRCKLDPELAVKESEREFFLSKRASRMKLILFDRNSRNDTRTADGHIILDYKK